VRGPSRQGGSRATIRCVSELAELLELLHGADAPFETLYGRFRTWHHHERAQEAFKAYAAGRAISGRFGRGELPVETEDFLTLWRQQPDRARMERDGSYGVRAGDRWWLWMEQTGAISNEGDDSAQSHVGQELRSLLSPAPLLGPLRLEPAGRSERAGREVIVVNGRLRDSGHPAEDSFALHELGLGADRYRLEVDAERGMVLASQALFEDAPFSEITALELTLDEPLDPVLFEFSPPEGEEVRAPLEIRHLKQNVSIAEAQAATPFTVMIPERVPSNWHVRCSFVDSERPSVHLHYHSDSAHESLNISQGHVSDLGPEIDEEEFEQARAGERTVWVRRRDERWPQAQLFMEHEGTRIQMTSDSLTAEQLIGLAAMLVPAPSASDL
jgi:hypothetical protein